MSKNLTTERIHVAIGIIYNAKRDKILISKRGEQQYLASFWELPGGKVNAGESGYSALKRELFEELNIAVINAESLMRINHDYPDKKVLLDVWSVYDWNGAIDNREGQEITWVALDRLAQYNFPAANSRVIALISLPAVYVISPPAYTSSQQFLSLIKNCFNNGLRLFQLRLKQSQNDNHQALINDIKKLAERYDAKFILNGTLKDINNYCLDGIHLNSHELFNYSSRPIANNYLLGASCHNEAELAQAAALAVNYVFISPVKATNSHPRAAVLGWHKFSQLAKKINVPVYALGGLSTQQLSEAKSFGAYGIAMLSAIWGAEDPGSAMQSCLCR